MVAARLWCVCVCVSVCVRVCVCVCMCEDSPSKLTVPPTRHSDERNPTFGGKSVF